MLMHEYGWTLEYVEDLDAIKFLTQLRVIQKRQADTNLMLGIVSSMANSNEEGWNNFRKSLGFVEMMNDMANQEIAMKSADALTGLLKQYSMG